MNWDWSTNQSRTLLQQTAQRRMQSESKKLFGYFVAFGPICFKTFDTICASRSSSYIGFLNETKLRGTSQHWLNKSPYFALHYETRYPLTLQLFFFRKPKINIPGLCRWYVSHNFQLSNLWLILGGYFACMIYIYIWNYIYTRSFPRFPISQKHNFRFTFSCLLMKSLPFSSLFQTRSDRPPFRPVLVPGEALGQRNWNLVAEKKHGNYSYIHHKQHKP